MKKVASISGGRTSAYMAANYHFDYFVFSLVRTNDKNLLFKDRVTAKIVEDKISADFIGTLEYDEIIYTVLDLEQFLGKKIHWVSGRTFDEILIGRNFLPNISKRFCTTQLKIEPIVKWWHSVFNYEPIETGIGYRANENKRVFSMMEDCDKSGLTSFKVSFSKYGNGRNRWENVLWRKPYFPLYLDGIFADDVHNFWKGKSVSFADYNNCVGCFHRNYLLLKRMFEVQPEKMQWFSEKEIPGKMMWKKDIWYNKIKSSNIQSSLLENDSFCSEGFCGI